MPLPTQPRERGERGPGSLVRLPWSGSDAELASLLREGNGAARAIAYDRFSGDVHRLIWRVMGADHEHEDLAQQVFARLFVDVARLREPDRLRGWVVALTLNIARAELRRRSRRRWLRSLIPAAAEHHDAHEVNDLVRRSNAFLDRLAADDRVAFVLRHVEGYSIDEVAAACGCSAATVHRRLARVAQRLKRWVERDPGLRELVPATAREGGPDDPG